MEGEKCSRVKVHSRLTVVSSTPTEPGTIHKFNALDHAMGMHRIHMIFYYRFNPFEMEFDLNDSRVSLSEILSKYPLVTGRLARDEDGNWVVKCTDAGVRMIRASVGTSLDEWLRSADADEERDLTVWDDMPTDPYIWSPFKIQINEFEGGGLAMGLSCLHMHANPTSITLLLNSWTQHKRNEPLAHPPVFHLPSVGTQSVHGTNTKSAKYYEIKSKEETTSPGMATATFRFPSLTMKQRLSQVRDQCPDANPFDLLAALFWSRVAQLKEATNNHKHSLSIGMDFKNYGKKSIPLGYFGNAIHFSVLEIDAEDLKSDALGKVALLVHQHVKSIEEEDFQSSLEYLESRKGENGKYLPPFKMYGPELTCVSMEHMINSEGSVDESLMYAATFKENEKPLHVSCHVENVEGEGLIVVMPSPEGGHGRTVMVTLPAEQIASICEDEAILQLEPIMLLTGKK